MARGEAGEITTERAEELAATEGLPVHRSLWTDAARRFVRNRLAMVGLALVVALVGLAVLAPAVQRHDYRVQDLPAAREGPSATYWFGTDQLGRDQWSRVVNGARISLSVGIVTQIFTVVIGVVIGGLAGLVRWADNLLMRFTDIAYSFPDLLMMILLISVLGSGLLVFGFVPVTMILAISLVWWPTIARLVRGQILSLQERDFTLAAKAMGASQPRIVWVHLLPHTFGPVIVTATFGIPRAIFVEAALSFIGLGIPPPNPSWGTLVNDGFRFIQAAPHLVISSALAIAVTMMSFTFIGDGLRDAFDPRAR
jgi:oligopeptide transport system permease protein